MATNRELQTQVDELQSEIARLRAQLAAAEQNQRVSSVGSLHAQPGLAYVELPHGGLLEVWRNTTTAEDDLPGLISVYSA